MDFEHVYMYTLSSASSLSTALVASSCRFLASLDSRRRQMADFCTCECGGEGIRGGVEVEGSRGGKGGGIRGERGEGKEGEEEKERKSDERTEDYEVWFKMHTRV